jgi:hypothetical protein
MKRSLTSNTAQQVAAANLPTRARAFAPAVPFRTALLGVLALAATMGSAMAQETPSIKAAQENPQTLAFTVENPGKEVLQMRVFNLDNKTCVAKEVNSNPSYGCKLNFAKLPAGRYAVLVRVGSERYRYNVQVQSQTATQNTISVPGLSTPSATPVVAALVR